MALVAAVAAPDAVFSERAAISAVPRTGAILTLGSNSARLASRGGSEKWFPEHLIRTRPVMAAYDVFDDALT